MINLEGEHNSGGGGLCVRLSEVRTLRHCSNHNKKLDLLSLRAFSGTALSARRAGSGSDRG